MTELSRQESYTVRFAGDSGDGIQLQGLQFTTTTAASGYDLATFPDFPAEIRAPAGTRFGVSAFQIQFGGKRVTTPGDTPEILVAFNPAALVVNLSDLKPGALIILDPDQFTQQHLKRAELTSNPLSDGSLSSFEVWEIDITRLTLAAVQDYGLGTKASARCKNFWVLGLVLWLFNQPRTRVSEWISNKFADPLVRDSNIAALNAGHAYAETTELAPKQRQEPLPASFLEGVDYRTVMGSEALALGLMAAAERTGLDLLFCSYPITPASSVLHYLSGLQDIGVATFQAEDEIAAVCAAIGASYAGKLGITSSSGPGIALKTEGIGLAIAAELPLVVLNFQRSGPSTGMPTKTDQSDLYQAVYGRNADAPLPVIAARSPSDSFEAAIEAVTLALRHMTPVILLSDGYIANASELWPVPDLASFEISGVNTRSGSSAKLFERDPATYARPWLRPGQAEHIHRIGGLEKDLLTGHISYDSQNHQAMTDMRLAKVESVADFIPPCKLESGTPEGLAVVAWGSTYGAIRQAVEELLKEGFQLGHVHLRHLNPLPRDLPGLLSSFDEILVVEMNTGQLASILRDKLQLKVRQLNQVTGQPFNVDTVKSFIRGLLAEEKSLELTQTQVN